MNRRGGTNGRGRPRRGNAGGRRRSAAAGAGAGAADPRDDQLLLNSNRRYPMRSTRSDAETNTTNRRNPIRSTRTTTSSAGPIDDDPELPQQQQNLDSTSTTTASTANRRSTVDTLAPSTRSITTAPSSSEDEAGRSRRRRRRGGSDIDRFSEIESDDDDSSSPGPTTTVPTTSAVGRTSTTSTVPSPSPESDRSASSQQDGDESDDKEEEEVEVKDEEVDEEDEEVEDDAGDEESEEDVEEGSECEDEDEVEVEKEEDDGEESDEEDHQLEKETDDEAGEDSAVLTKRQKECLSFLQQIKDYRGDGGPPGEILDRRETDFGFNDDNVEEFYEDWVRHVFHVLTKRFCHLLIFYRPQIVALDDVKQYVAEFFKDEGWKYLSELRKAPHRRVSKGLRSWLKKPNFEDSFAVAVSVASLMSLHRDMTYLTADYVSGPYESSIFRGMDDDEDWIRFIDNLCPEASPYTIKRDKELLLELWNAFDDEGKYEGLDDIPLPVFLIDGVIDRQLGSEDQNSTSDAGDEDGGFEGQPSASGDDDQENDDQDDVSNNNRDSTIRILIRAIPSLSDMHIPMATELASAMHMKHGADKVSQDVERLESLRRLMEDADKLDVNPIEFLNSVNTQHLDGQKIESLRLLLKEALDRGVDPVEFVNGINRYEPAAHVNEIESDSGENEQIQGRQIPQAPPIITEERFKELLDNVGVPKKEDVSDLTLYMRLSPDQPKEFKKFPKLKESARHDLRVLLHFAGLTYNDIVQVVVSEYNEEKHWLLLYQFGGISYDTYKSLSVALKDRTGRVSPHLSSSSVVRKLTEDYPKDARKAIYKELAHPTLRQNEGFLVRSGIPFPFFCDYDDLRALTPSLKKAWKSNPVLATYGYRLEGDKILSRDGVEITKWEKFKDNWLDQTAPGDDKERKYFLFVNIYAFVEPIHDFLEFTLPQDGYTYDRHGQAEE